ncbi:U2-type spliceosomal complex subunit CWC25 KNAG_0F00700 [Huiozyma naganishii CBS 8797]|uniref:Pre-mRNA-splicing factor CWC25 n=1 Tax=Huiozyma naganishii (strain ATCC MYA-139 / BCRC 22969 / CBS 8797 / KCTC 17520 / NBRC 10181 / NCYC 3082 / Yp74L-3) TaxID=1071383 RepID=J7S730_HUIN7|nr:hypothetical protein KNAG_0F00700 [Kazachstania naganishii CBS 8797]CCK70739.1 hypothetical protein KNAG_0F00700 [Kazachstania naganishii CBS 8797]
MANDLNLLKSWNPKLVRNRKKVWEREQELLKEEHAFKQRQREIQKERELDSLVNASRDGDRTGDRKKTGLEWMYDTGAGGSESNQEYLLGKKKLDSSVIKSPQTEETDKSKQQQKQVQKQKRKKASYDMDDPMSKVLKLQGSKNKISKRRTPK